MNCNVMQRNALKEEEVRSYKGGDIRSGWKVVSDEIGYYINCADVLLLDC